MLYCNFCRFSFLDIILREIKVITGKIIDDEGDWKFASMVIDSLCLIVYTIFTILATVVVLWTACYCCLIKVFVLHNSFRMCSYLLINYPLQSLPIFMNH